MNVIVFFFFYRRCESFCYEKRTKFI